MSEEHKQRTLEMIAVMQAYVDGKPIEYRPNMGEWAVVDVPVWAFDAVTYRIATTPDTINWDHVSPEWKYMARDHSGIPFLYDIVPMATSVEWYQRGGKAAVATGFASYVRGTVDWKDSLVVRPS